MCHNCTNTYGFDLGHGCSANAREAAERYCKLREIVEEKIVPHIEEDDVDTDEAYSLLWDVRRVVREGFRREW